MAAVKELLDLPDDALVHILGVAGIRECGALARCCTRLRPLLGPDALIWRLHLHRTAIAWLPESLADRVDASGACARELLKAYAAPPTGLVMDSASTKLSTSGLVARFAGQLGSDQAVRADAPVPNASIFTALRARAVDGAPPTLTLTLSRVYYFEARISAAAEGTTLDIGTHRPPCVSIGLATRRFPLRRKQPGWDVHSLAYHGDDGHIFHGSGVSSANFGPIFSAGDTVGCGIHLGLRRVFFTLNGEYLGSPFALPTLGGPRSPELFAAVGIDTHRRVALNFGAQPFAFDAEAAETSMLESDAKLRAANARVLMIPAFISGSELDSDSDESELSGESDEGMFDEEELDGLSDGEGEYVSAHAQLQMLMGMAAELADDESDFPDTWHYANEYDADEHEASGDDEGDLSYGAAADTHGA